MTPVSLEAIQGDLWAVANAMAVARDLCKEDGSEECIKAAAILDLADSRIVRVLDAISKGEVTP